MEWACGHVGHEQDLTVVELPNGKTFYTMELKVAKPTEVCQYFLQGMVDRMAVSFHKYGPLTEAPKPPNNIDEIAGLKKRLALYEETGNGEWLVDVANFAMIETMLKYHPSYHFRPTDSDESPGLIDAKGEASQKSHADRKNFGASGQLAARIREGREGD